MNHHGISIIGTRFTSLRNFVIRCDQVTRMFRSGHDCTSTPSARSPCYWRLHAEFTIWVLGKVRKHTVLNVLFLSRQFDVITHTQIRITLFHGVRISIPNWKPSPNRASIGFSQIAFPITVLPKDDRTDFAEEERLGLPYWTMIWAICVSADVPWVYGLNCRLN